MAKSAACGAWIDLDGQPAHRFCEGRVLLPAPDDICECPCHKEDEGS